MANKHYANWWGVAHTWHFWKRTMGSRLDGRISRFTSGLRFLVSQERKEWKIKKGNVPKSTGVPGTKRGTNRLGCHPARILKDLGVVASPNQRKLDRKSRGHGRGSGVSQPLG